MATKRYDRLRRVIKPGSKALILIQPDPDSLASAYALSVIIRKNQGSAAIALCRPIKRIENRKMVNLLRIPVLPFKKAMLGSYDVKCTVDAQPGQLSDSNVPAWDVVIDHHPLEQGPPSAFSDVRPEMGATSSMMVEYLEDAGVRITQRIATALCYGILTDTNHFQRAVTKLDALAFSRLFPNADYELLRIIESKEIPTRQLVYFNVAMQRFHIKNRRVVIHIGATESSDIAVVLADFFLRVSGVHVVAVSCIVDEKLTIVFRSMGLRRNVGRMAEIHFSDIGSAGGHIYAARAEIPLGNLPSEVKGYSFDSIERLIDSRLTQSGTHSAKRSEPHERGKGQRGT